MTPTIYLSVRPKGNAPESGRTLYHIIISMSFFKGLFKKYDHEIAAICNELKLDESQKQTLYQFSSLNSDDRVRKMMTFGNSGNLSYFKLLEYAIKYDADINVKFAALKRLHLFKDHPECKTMIVNLNNYIEVNTLEPYYSMASHKLNLISLEEFKRRVNGE